MPPGISLPESLLSPGLPGGVSLMQAGSPGSRAQSAGSPQLTPLRSRSIASQGGHADWASMTGSPKGGTSAGLGPKQAGSLSSAHSTQNMQALGLRQGSIINGGSGRLGHGKPWSGPSSRVGSAGKKSAVGELDEYDNIKVAVRVRPPNAQELARADSQALFVNPNDYRQIQLAVPGVNGAIVAKHFAFHACLGPTSRQHDVIRLCGINQLLDAALDGFNTTIMAYGQTGSGKTYTMTGREDVIMDDDYMGDTDDGIMTRSAAYLFAQMQNRNDGCKYTFRVSYLEIYNEAVYDLLKFDKKQLQVRWDATKGFHVPDLFAKECACLEDLLKAISRGMRHRRVGSHELNLESSRSHSIMTIYCDCTPVRSDDHEYGTTRFGKVSLVDLAGSERVRDSRSSGETLKETTNINRSLFMLGNVISALAEGARGARVPYRDSKLTRLLMDSLGGSSLSLIIACCSPSASHVDETLSTLSYACRAKNIRNQPIQQVDPQEAAIAALKREVRLLRTENAFLREQLFQANMPRGQAPPSPLLVAQREAHGADETHVRPGVMSRPSPFDTEFAPTTAPASAQPPIAEHCTDVHTETSSGMGPVSRPPSAGKQKEPAALTPAQAGSITSEELLRRLLETQRMLVQFSRENDRLASENGRLRAGKNLVATDYQGALEEVEWLRTKLESLESSLIRASVDASSGIATKPDQPTADAAATQSPTMASPNMEQMEELEGIHLPSAVPVDPKELVPCESAALDECKQQADDDIAEEQGGGADTERLAPAQHAGGKDADVKADHDLDQVDNVDRLSDDAEAWAKLGNKPLLSSGSKAPLIAQELLQDPSELKAAATTKVAQVKQVEDTTKQRMQQQVDCDTMAAQHRELAAHAVHIELADETSSDDVNGVDECLPVGDKEVKVSMEGTHATVSAVVTVSPSIQKAPHAWVAGEELLNNSEKQECDIVVAAAEKLHLMVKAQEVSSA